VRVLLWLCRGVFATHLHLLVPMLEDVPNIEPYRMEVVACDTPAGKVTAHSGMWQACTGRRCGVVFVQVHKATGSCVRLKHCVSAMRACIVGAARRSVGGWGHAGCV
jgi:hypothetical protein